MKTVENFRWWAKLIPLPILFFLTLLGLPFYMMLGATIGCVKGIYEGFDAWCGEITEVVITSCGTKGTDV